MYHIGIRKQSCYFDKVCDREFNRKHIEVNLFSLQLFIHEKRLTVLSEKKKNTQNLFQEVGDHFLKFPGR